MFAFAREMEAEPGRNKRKGGPAQRLQQAHGEYVSDGKLYPLLMTYLAKGVLSGVLCSAISQAVVADIEAAVNGTELDKLKKLASIKSGGKVQQVVENQMRKESCLPQPLLVDMPYGSGETPSSSPSST